VQMDYSVQEESYLLGKLVQCPPAKAGLLMVFRDQEYDIDIHGELDIQSQFGPFHQHAITLVSKGPDSAQISPAQINADGPMLDAMMPHGVRIH
jgi:hypothetical protein